MKILIVRFSSIGDIVLTSSVVRAVKQQLPNVEIHYLTKDKFQSLVSNNPNISKVHTINKSIDEVISALKDESFDYIIDLHNNLRTAALKRKLRVKSTTFNKLNFQKFLLVKFKINRMPNVHVVDRYFDAVKVLGVKNDQQPGNFFISKSDEVEIEKTFNFAPKSYYSIAIGAQFGTKRMPVSLLVNIIKGFDKSVVIVGGEMDKEMADSIVSKCEEKTVVNACGLYSLGASASIVSQSLRLLTNDTGMMHIAACLDIPISSVWGNTTPNLGMYPYYPGESEKYSIHQVEGLNCRPCSKIGFQECPKKHFNCMNLQNEQEIISAMEDE